MVPVPNQRQIKLISEMLTDDPDIFCEHFTISESVNITALKAARAALSAGSSVTEILAGVTGAAIETAIWALPGLIGTLIGCPTLPSGEPQIEKAYETFAQAPRTLFTFLNSAIDEIEGKQLHEAIGSSMSGGSMAGSLSQSQPKPSEVMAVKNEKPPDPAEIRQQAKTMMGDTSDMAQTGNMQDILQKQEEQQQELEQAQKKEMEPQMQSLDDASNRLNALITPMQTANQNMAQQAPNLDKTIADLNAAVQNVHRTI